jgi:hypothetical protein
MIEKENFVRFIKKNKKFFVENRNKFIDVLLQLILKSSPNIKKDQKLKEEVEEFYDLLFIEPIIQMDDEFNIDQALFDVNYVSILNKFFLIMSNGYIKNIIKETNSIEKLFNFTKLCNFYIQYLTKCKEKNNHYKTIPKEIKQLFINKKPIIYLTVFRGVPISYKTYIDEIDENSNEITLKISSYQIVASKLQDKAYIIDPDTAKAFTASIEDVLLNTKQAILYNFVSTKRENIKRSYIRVQPKDNVEVIMKNQKYSHSGTIYDISLKGVAVINKKDDNIKVSDMFNLKFDLEVNNISFSLDIFAKLVSITEIVDDNTKYNYHFSFELSKKEELMLEKYIAFREKEIINELNEYLKQTIL